eukprot:g27482.t1
MFAPKVSTFGHPSPIRRSIFGGRWSLGSANDDVTTRRSESAKSLEDYRNRFEKGFTMVEEEELGIAFCTRAKMRRKKASESQFFEWLRWLFGKLSPSSPKQTTWHVIASKQVSMVLKVSALASFTTVMALVALEPICIDSSEGAVFARLGSSAHGFNVVCVLHFLNSLMYLIGSMWYHLHLFYMDETSVGVFDITLQLSSRKRRTTGSHKNELRRSFSPYVIGANYSPKSRSLSIDHEARAHASRETTGGGLQAWLGSRVVPGLARARDTSGAKLRVRIEDIQMSKKEFCRILSRYRHYTEGGIPADVLAPYHRQWLEHAVLLLEFENPARWPMLSEEEQTNLIEELRTEILKGYIRAAKTTVVNYALLDERCRKRLDVPFIPSPPPIWGCLTFQVPDIGTPGERWQEQTPPEHPAFDGFEFLELLDVAEYPRAVAVEHEDAEEQGEELQRPSGISGRSMMSFLESLKGWTSHAFSFPKLLTPRGDRDESRSTPTGGLTRVHRPADHYKHLPQIRPYIDLSRAECVDLQAIHRGEDADKEAAEHVVKCLYDGISPQLRSLSDSFAPLYMVMNFVGSDDVDKWWAKQSSVKGMLLGLRFLAESQTDTQWVHHDLKPQNMVVTDDTAETVLVDFGTVLSSKEPKKTLL